MKEFEKDYVVEIEAVKGSYDENTDEYNYVNYDTVDEHRIKKNVDDYLANYFDFDFDYSGFNIWFGEGIEEGNIFLADESFGIVEFDDEEVVVYVYDYERLENGNIKIVFERGDGYKIAKKICKNTISRESITIVDLEDEDTFICKYYGEGLYSCSGYEVDGYFSDPVSVFEAYNFNNDMDYKEELKKVRDFVETNKK